MVCVVTGDVYKVVIMNTLCVYTSRVVCFLLYSVNVCSGIFYKCYFQLYLEKFCVGVRKTSVYKGEATGK